MRFGQFRAAGAVAALARDAACPPMGNERRDESFCAAAIAFVAARPADRRGDARHHRRRHGVKAGRARAAVEAESCG
jgi:hypothetical protein